MMLYLNNGIDLDLYVCAASGEIAGKSQAIISAIRRVSREDTSNDKGFIISISQYDGSEMHSLHVPCKKYS
jgi:hypothetical protein